MKLINCTNRLVIDKLLISYETTKYVHISYQRQLEESLFRHHPASLRRTAEFIADRVASNAIKKLQQTVLKAVMNECQQWASAEITNQLVTTPDADMLVCPLIMY